MKKLIILVIALLSISAGYAQNLINMPETERNKILIQKAKETVLKHGPGYYREFKPPVIELRIDDESGGMPCTTEEEALKIDGRIVYSVGFPYDMDYELMGYGGGLAAHVFIWGDTGVVFKVSFGNGTSVRDLDKLSTRSDGQVEVIPYERRPPYKPKQPKADMVGPNGEIIPYGTYPNL